MDFGRTGLIDLAMTPRDHPASQRARRRPGISSGDIAEIKRTSSSGNFWLCFTALSYSLFQKRTVSVEAAEALDESLKYMNITVFCFWPARRLCIGVARFQIVSGVFFTFCLFLFS